MADRSVSVKLTANITGYMAGMAAAGAATKAFTKELDSSTGRATNLTQSLLAVGPALVPIGAAGVPVISGLTNQLAFAAAGAGVTALAFSGVGDALKATNDYAIAPTDANLQQMRQSLAELGPAGREFVAFLQEIRPELQGLQDAAQAGLFPGAEAGIRDLMLLMPQAERIVSTVASSIGELIAEAGDNLNDPRWQEFFTFLENEARPTLLDMGRTAGNLAESFANLWMAFDPLSDNFSASFLQMSRDFAVWTDGLDQTQGFQEFVDYVTRVGPQAWDTLAALGNALIQIVEAAAPIGEVSLPILKLLADSLALIADSPAGPILIGAAAGISALSRAVALYKIANGTALTSMVERLGGKGAVMRSAAAGAGLFALSMTDLDEKMGLSNTATFALAGAITGPWGAAVGAGVGLAMDFASANDDVWSAVTRANAVLSDSGSSLADQAAAVDAARDKIIELQSTIADNKDFSLGGIIKTDKNALEGLFGSSDVEEANAALKSLEDRQAKNVAAAQDLAFEEAGLGSAMSGASQAARDQAQAMLANVDALNKMANEASSAQAGMIAYEQAVDDATAAAKKNGRTLDIDTQKGRDNYSALLRLRDIWAALTPAQQNAAGASKKARAEFIRVAMAMGRTRTQAQRLADKYLAVPTKISTKVKLSGAIPATKQAQALKTALEAIPELTTTTIRTIMDTFIVPPHSDPAPSLKGMLTPAAGGYIRGSGTTTSDSIPAWLSDKEYVVKASSVEKYGVSFFDAVNAGQYASGGLTGPRTREFAGVAAAPVAAAGPTSMVARLVDPTVRVHKNGLVELMDDRVLIGVSQNNRHEATARRSSGRN